MDRDEAIRRAEIFLSYLREEKQYQFRTGDDPDTWIDLHPYQGQETYLVRFLDPFYQIRPKPQPLECWVWIPDEPNVLELEPVFFRDKAEEQEMAQLSYRKRGRVVHMREVTKE